MVLKAYKVVFGQKKNDNADIDLQESLPEERAKYGYGKKEAFIPVKRKGKVFQAKRMVGRKMPEKQAGWKMSPKMDYAMVVSRENPLASVGKYDGGGRVHKFVVNMDTGELAFSTDKNMSHAYITANYGAKGKDEKTDTWVRGIYDPERNVIGIRTPEIISDLGYSSREELEDAEARSFETQMDIYEKLAVNNPSLKLCMNITDNDLEFAWHKFDASRVDQDRIIGIDTLPQSILNRRLNPYSLGITPFRKEHDTGEKIKDMFNTRRYREWNADLMQMSKKLGISLDEQFRAVGRWEQSIEPSYVVNVSDSKEAISKLGAMLGKKYNQDSVMFVQTKADGAERVAEIQLDPETDVDEIHEQLSKSGLPGSTITLEDGNLIIGILSNEDRGNLDKFLGKISDSVKDFNLHSANITFVGMADYDKYLKGLEVIKSSRGGEIHA